MGFVLLVSATAQVHGGLACSKTTQRQLMYLAFFVTTESLFGDALTGPEQNNGQHNSESRKAGAVHCTER